MSSATTGQNQNISDTISAHSSRGFAHFPTEIVRLIFEESVAPRSLANDDQQRQRSAYACCLVSKEVRAWIETSLYAKVVLESSNQVMAFLDALESKSAEFLTRTVKTVWILDDSFPDDAVDRFHCLFSKCKSLESLACLGSGPCGQILQLIPKPQNGSHALRELAIIRPGQRTARNLDLTHLSIQRMQIIDSCRIFARALSRRAVKDELFVDALRKIPHISFDFVVPPDPRHNLVIKSKLIPLLISGTPGSKSVFCLRSSPITSLRLNGWSSYKDVDSWVETLDADVKQCGGRLLVCVKSDSQKGIDPGAPSTIERCRQWISLD